MDWSRAKTILIVSFLLLDTLLGIRWMQERGGASSTWAASGDSVTRTRAALRREGIIVSGSLPSRTPATLPGLGVSARREDDDRLGGGVFLPGPGGRRFRVAAMRGSSSAAANSSPCCLRA